MSNIRITELDFDQIKLNLKNYLKSQTTFNSYDFEGSGLSVLLDILSYNTHYNAFLANMLANEMFLDSAVKRASVVSLAKALGYTPRSARGAIANISFSITVNNATNPYIVLPKYTSFTTSVGGNNLTFYSTEDVVGEKSGDVYSFVSVPIKEGQILTYAFNVVTPGPTEKYILPNNNVDTTTLIVNVQNSSTDTTTFYYRNFLDISDVTETSRAYFLDENKNNQYEIYFGDGVLGRKLVAGNIINLTYSTCSGSLGNASTTESPIFSLSFISGVGSVSINPGSLVVNTLPSNGSDAEGIDSIKFNAPKFRSSQNRAVTASDYAAVIRASNPNIESISVWGGEENSPPVYGKVFIAIKPTTGYIITDSVKNYIKNVVLKDKKVMSVIPELVDPDYIYVNLKTDISYNSTITSLNASKIVDLASGAIQTYFDVELEKFNKPLSFSKLLNTIDTVSPSITNTNLSIGLQRRISPTLSTKNEYTDTNNIKFYNRIHPNSLVSTYFYVQYAGVTTKVYIKDVATSNPPNYDGSGNIRLIRESDDLIINDTFGSVNYKTGEVEIGELIPVSFPTGISDIRINVDLQRASYNVSSQKNLILILDDTDANVTSGRKSGLVVNAFPVSE